MRPIPINLTGAFGEFALLKVAIFELCHGHHLGDIAGDSVRISLYFFSSDHRRCCRLGSGYLVSAFICINFFAPIFIVTNEFLFVSCRPRHVVAYFCPGINVAVEQRRCAVARHAVWNRTVEKRPAARVVSLKRDFRHVLILQTVQTVLVESVDRIGNFNRAIIRHPGNEIQCLMDPPSKWLGSVGR